MPKYMIVASYTAEGAAGVLKEGGSGRVAAVKTAVEALGGSVESFYFAFGDADAYVVVDVPDASDAAAMALTVGASRGAATKTICLLTPEQVDAAARKSTSYRAPGA